MKKRTTLCLSGILALSVVVAALVSCYNPSLFDQPPQTSLRFDRTEVHLQEGGSTYIRVFLRPNVIDTDGTPVTGNVTWDSSDISVATVESGSVIARDGTSRIRITAEGPGQTVIRAETTGTNVSGGPFVARITVIVRENGGSGCCGTCPPGCYDCDGDCEDCDCAGSGSGCDGNCTTCACSPPTCDTSCCTHDCTSEGCSYPCPHTCDASCCPCSYPCACPCGCNGYGPGPPPPPPPPPPATGLYFDASFPINHLYGMAAGDHEYITVRLYPPGATGNIRWESSDTSVATVTPDVATLVTGYHEARVTALSNQESDRATISVYLVGNRSIMASRVVTIP